MVQSLRAVKAVTRLQAGLDSAEAGLAVALVAVADLAAEASEDFNAASMTQLSNKSRR